MTKPVKKPVKKPASGQVPMPAADAPQPGQGGGEASFPIVAIGASAGGLEAIELFLSRMPVDSGMAFVIILHLDPNH